MKSIYFFALFILLALLGRVINLQLFSSAALKSKARNIHLSKISALKIRRSIVDRNNRLIAYDKPLYRLWAHPKYFNFPGDPSNKLRTIDEVVSKLSPILNVDKNELIAKFENQNIGVKLFDNLTEDQAINVRKLYISGLDLEIHSKRFYPQSDLFSNIVGFVNDDKNGSSGLELHLDKKIRILKKSNILKKGADGTPLPDISGPNDFLEDDKKIVLTLDSRLQKVAFNVLSKQVKEWRAKKGFALVMNVKNGEILSLVSSPSFDPNKFWEYDHSLFKGWYSQDLFEPGSTFKPINLALALEEKVIKENGYVQDNGKINVGGWTLSNWNEKGNGFISYPKVLQVSSNVGMVKIMQRLSPSKYWERLNKLGIDRKIKTDLVDSTPGYLKNKDIFVNQPIEQAVASFGKGFSISPLKLAQLHASLANGGYEITPHVTYNFKKDISNYPKRRLFSYEVSQIILEWMESVVNEGSGIGAKIDGYRIGGKTGTSQKAINGIYTQEKACSFVATLPIDDPEYLVLVVVDGPSKSFAYGSTVAVPVAKEIIESLIVLEKIPPSMKETMEIVKKL
tara:strand:+ start:847 stop:2547 length:1701 start_codon:yes stop_codon:yes gene_type:complete